MNTEATEGQEQNPNPHRNDPTVYGPKPIHYVLYEGPAKGAVRPAIITDVIHGGIVQLQVFTDSDGEGRYNDELPCPHWATSVQFDAEGAPGTWHWPETI